MDKIKDIVPQVIKELAPSEQPFTLRIQTLWDQKNDQSIKEHTAIERFDKGCLFILVDSPAWLFQMNLKKRKILEELNNQINEIESIQFKIGKIQ